MSVVVSCADRVHLEAGTVVDRRQSEFVLVCGRCTINLRLSDVHRVDCVRFVGSWCGHCDHHPSVTIRGKQCIQSAGWLAGWVEMKCVETMK